MYILHQVTIQTKYILNIIQFFRINKKLFGCICFLFAPDHKTNSRLIFISCAKLCLKYLNRPRKPHTVSSFHLELWKKIYSTYLAVYAQDDLGSILWNFFKHLITTGLKIRMLKRCYSHPNSCGVNFTPQELSGVNLHLRGAFSHC